MSIKIYLLVLIVIIIIIIMIWGGITQWKFENNYDYFSKPIIKFISYADDRFGRKGGKFIKTQEKMTKLFQNHPQINDITSYTDKDLINTNFYIKNKILLDKGPSLTDGAGNMQKLYFIEQELNYIPENSYLLYHDASPECWENIKANHGTKFQKLSNNAYNNISFIPYLEMCDKNKGILVGKARHTENITHRFYTSPTCIRLMGLEQFIDKFQICTSWILLKNTKHVRKIISEALDYITNENCASYYKNKKIDKKIEPLFHENRGDQSVLGLLLLKYDMPFVLPTKNKNILSIDFTSI